MRKIFPAMIVLALCGMSTIAVDARAFMQEQPAPPSAAPPPLTTYLPENAAAFWNVLAETSERSEERADGIWLVPVFSDRVRALNGTVVRATGFMFPIETAEQHSYFLLQPRPPHCPFCFNIGANQVIEVRADMPVPYSLEPVTLEGSLTLVEDDESGIFYRMSAARAVN